MLTGNSTTNFLVLEVDLKCQARIVCVFILFFLSPPLTFNSKHAKIKTTPFQATGFELYVQLFLSE